MHCTVTQEPLLSPWPGERERQSWSGGQTKLWHDFSHSTSPAAGHVLSYPEPAACFYPQPQGVPGCLSLPQDRQLWQLSPPQGQGQRHSTTGDLRTPAEGKQSPAPGVAGELQSCRKNISPQLSGDTRAWGWQSLARGWELLCSQAEGRQGMLPAWPWTLLCFPSFHPLQQQPLPALSSLSTPRLRMHCHGQNTPALPAGKAGAGRQSHSLSPTREGRPGLAGSRTPRQWGKGSRTPR